MLSCKKICNNANCVLKIGLIFLLQNVISQFCNFACDLGVKCDVEVFS